MDSYQGFASRKLCAEVGQAMAMAMAMATTPSSTPSPFLDADAASPSTTKSDMKPITAVAVVFFFTAFLLVAFFCIHFQRYCSLRHARTVLYDRPTHGLDGSFLETLPKVTFSSSSVLQTEEKEKEKDKEKGKEAMATETATATECAICLEEFSEQETLVRLPHCGHSFHLECVSLWLFSHTDCPLCRHSLLPHPDNGNNCNGSDNGNCNDSDSGNSNGNGNDNRNANAIAIAIASSPSSL